MHPSSSNSRGERSLCVFAGTDRIRRPYHAAWEAAGNAGAIQVDGMTIDRPVVLASRRTLAIAERMKRSLERNSAAAEVIGDSRVFSLRPRDSQYFQRAA